MSALVPVDTYTYRARLLPALLALFAPLVTVMLLFPPVYQRIGASVFTLGSTCGLLVFFGHLARMRGHISETRLIARSGAMPSIVMLRHRDASIDPQTKRRYHAFLSARVPGLRLPTAAQEDANAIDADESYRSAVKWLLEFTRDKAQHPMVFSESVSYGFRRNLLGLKPLALVLWAASLAAATVVIVRAPTRAVADIPAPYAVLCLVLATSLACWAFVVTENSVIDASRAYATALLAACDRPSARAKEDPSTRSVIVS